MACCGAWLRLAVRDIFERYVKLGLVAVLLTECEWINLCCRVSRTLFAGFKDAPTYRSANELTRFLSRASIAAVIAAKSRKS